MVEESDWLKTGHAATGTAGPAPDPALGPAVGPDPRADPSPGAGPGPEAEVRTRRGRAEARAGVEARAQEATVTIAARAGLVANLGQGHGQSQWIGNPDHLMKIKWIHLLKNGMGTFE